MTSPLSGSVQVSKLARDLHRMGPAVRKSLAKRFEQLAGPLLADARRRAGWSTRIPGAISVKGTTDMTRGRVGLQLRVSAAAAPHARPYEGISSQGNEGYFRHPVFGNEDVWVPQETRPFAQPAMNAKGADARRAVEAAVTDAARDVGFT